MSLANSVHEAKGIAAKKRKTETWKSSLMASKHLKICGNIMKINELQMLFATPGAFSSHSQLAASRPVAADVSRRSWLRRSLEWTSNQPAWSNGIRRLTLAATSGLVLPFTHSLFTFVPFCATFFIFLLARF
jgi:hypothetical protein